jgi:hypothetical protein
MKIRYIGYTLNFLTTMAVASPTGTATANSLKFSKYLQFVTFALVLSTRQCLHSSLYYQECNELLIIFYITDVTSHTLSLFGKTYSTKFLIGFLRTNEEEIYIIHCVSQRSYKIIRRTTMFGCLLWFQGMNC